MDIANSLPRVTVHLMIIDTLNSKMFAKFCKNKNLALPFYSQREIMHQLQDFNPFMPNGMSHCYQLDHSQFRFKGCWVVVFIQILMEHSVSKQWRHKPDATEHDI